MTEEIAYFVKWRKIAEKNNVDVKFFANRPTPYTPNYNFYVPNLVCYQHGMPRIRWEPQYNRFTVEDAQKFGLAYCIEDGLLDPVSFKKCPACGGCFYDMFRHGFQTERDHHCWTCLENGSNRTAHPFYRKYTNLAPPEHLIPPVVTKESKADADKAFWDDINSILK